jgi:predicted phosphodiesterase
VNISGKLNKFAAAILLMGALVFHSGSGNLCSASGIVYPWRAAKAIVEEGNNFEILFDNRLASPIDAVILEGPFNRVVLQTDSVKIGRFEYDPYTRASTNYQIWVTVPRETPEELYSIVLKSGGQVFRSERSVKVVPHFRESHSFIHITDLHISRQWVGDPDDGYAKELELFDRFVEVANIIAPDFVIVTGDNIHEYTRVNADSTGWGGSLLFDADQRPLVEEKWKNYYEGAGGLSGIHGLNAPTFTVAGNHDFYGLAIDDHYALSVQWNKMSGKRVFGVSYGDTRILAVDDYLGDPEIDIPAEAPMSGLQGKFLESFLEEYGPGQMRIMAQHRHDRIDTAFVDRHKIQLLVNGHNHSPHHEYVGETPTLSIRPGVVARSGVRNVDEQLGFFRIIRIKGDTYDYSPPLRFTKDPTVPYEELELNLTLDFKHDNDGSSFKNRAVIRNRLGVDLPDCRVRFVMMKEDYAVSGGVIHQIIEHDEFTVVDVRVDVPENKQAEVSIRPVRR